MQCACAILSFVACPALQYFSTLSQKRHDFRRNVIEHQMCSDFLYKFCIKHFSFWEEVSEIWSKMCIGLHVNCPLFLSDANEAWIFSTYIWKSSNSKFNENLSSWSRIVLCGRTDRQTNRQSRRSKYSRFAILRTPLINPYHIQIHFVPRKEHFLFRSLVFSLRGRAGRNQSPVMWPVWLWHTASWASTWG